MKHLFIRSLNGSAANAASLILRVSFGALMIPHGVMKYNHFDEWKGEFMHFLGLSGAISMALVIIVEILCSVMLITGVLTRLAAVMLLIAAIVIVFFAHHGDILGDGSSGFFYLLAYLAILFLGPGQYSIDYLIGRRLANARQ